MLMFQNSQDGSTCDDIAIIIGNMDEGVEARLTSVQRAVHELQATMIGVQGMVQSLWNELEKIDKETEHRISHLPNEIVHLPPLNAHEEVSPSQQSAPHQALRDSSNRHSSFLAPNQSYVPSPYVPSSASQPGRSMHDQGQQLPPRLSISSPEHAQPFASPDHKPGQIRHRLSMTSKFAVGRGGIKPESTEQYIVVRSADGLGSRAQENSSSADSNIGSSSPHLYNDPKHSQKEKSPSVTKPFNQQMTNKVEYDSNNRKQVTKSPQKQSLSIQKRKPKTSQKKWVSRYQKSLFTVRYIREQDIPAGLDECQIPEQSKLLYLLISQLPLSQRLTLVRERLFEMYYRYKLRISFVYDTNRTHSSSSKKAVVEWIGSLIASSLSRLRFDHINFTETDEKIEIAVLIERVKVKCETVKQTFDNKTVLGQTDFYQFTETLRQMQHICQAISKLGYFTSRLNMMQSVETLYRRAFLSYANRVFGQPFLFMVGLGSQLKTCRRKNILILFNKLFKQQVQRSLGSEKQQQDSLSKPYSQFYGLVERHSDEINHHFSTMISLLKESRKSGSEDSLNSSLFVVNPDL